MVNIDLCNLYFIDIYIYGAGGLVAKLCLTLETPMEGFSVHGISQARILEWVAISFSGGLADPVMKPTSTALLADSY